MALFAINNKNGRLWHIHPEQAGQDEGARREMEDQGEDGEGEQSAEVEARSNICTVVNHEIIWDLENRCL